MKKHMKILFPTDFSEPASHAFRYALVLAGVIKANIQLIHAIFPETAAMDVPVVSANATQVRIEASDEAMKAFKELGLAQVATLGINLPDVVAATEIGAPVRTIIQAAKRDDVDLIIVGTRGERKGVDKMLGSVAAGVVQRATCAVMVVAEKVPLEGPANIAYATDLMDSDPLEIWRMIQLLKPFNPHVHCIHFTMADEMKESAGKVEQMKAFFEDHSSAISIEFHELPGKKLAEDLNHFVDDKDIDLLVMYQPKRNTMQRLFHRSKVKKMALNSHVPLLVQKEGQLISFQ